jgi:hypothetical protein
MRHTPSTRSILQMSRPQRDMILLHVAADQPVRAADSKVCRNALIRRGMLLLLPPGSPRPQYTTLSSLGRYAAAVLLAEYAEVLVRAGVLESDGQGESPMEVLRRLKAAKKASEPPILADLPPGTPHISLD